MRMHVHVYSIDQHACARRVYASMRGQGIAKYMLRAPIRVHAHVYSMHVWQHARAHSYASSECIRHSSVHSV